MMKRDENDIDKSRGGDSSDGVDNIKDESAATISASDADESYRAVAERERLKRIADFERSLTETVGKTDKEKGGSVVFPRQKSAPAKKSGIKKRNIHAGHRARLRESARRDSDLTSFSDIEILELLLSNAVPRKDTNPIAHALLDKFGSLLGAIRAPFSELVKIPSMTENAARLLGLLPIIGMRDEAGEVRMPSHFDLASLMISMFVGSDDDCTYAVFLDGEFGLIALERHDTKEFVDRAAVVGSVCKYSAKYVLTARRGGGAFPNISEFTAEISALKELLYSVGATLLDCMVVCDFGYYSLGTTALVGASPEFVFFPLQTFSRAPELVMKIIGHRPIERFDGDMDEKDE